MTRAMAALFAAAFAFPALALALGFGEALGGDWFVGGVTFALVICCGFPALSLYCKRRWWEPWRFIAGGTLCGALFALPFAGSGRFGFGYLVLIFALIGSLLAVAFWVAAIWRNEELTTPREFCLPCGIAYRYARNALRRRRARG
jgi:hypothetical protein